MKIVVDSNALNLFIFQFHFLAVDVHDGTGSFRDARMDYVVTFACSMKIRDLQIGATVRCWVP